MCPNRRSAPGIRKHLLNELADRLAAIEREHPLRVAIDGVDASGKTTFADELALLVEARGRSVIRASIDGFPTWRGAISHRDGFCTWPHYLSKRESFIR